MQRKKQQAMDPQQEENRGVTIDAFVSKQKVSAFCRSYELAPYESQDTITFNESRLREYFKADVCSVGDPLVQYLELLEAAGYIMTTSIAGEPAIIVRDKMPKIEN